MTVLVRPDHRAALRTVFLFLGGTLGAMEAVERLDDRIAEREEVR